jgi:hypothetical protein
MKKARTTAGLSGLAIQLWVLRLMERVGRQLPVVSIRFPNGGGPYGGLMASSFRSELEVGCQ